MWTDQGDFYFSNFVFEVTDFDGAFTDCALYEGDSLISDQASYYPWTNKYVMFDESTDSQKLLIGVQPRTFALWCQVETNSSPQTLSVQFAGGFFRTGPSGMYTYINNGPWGHELTFVQPDTLNTWLDGNNPTLIVPGVKVPLMRFRMATSTGEAKLYSLPFLFRNAAGSYTNCEIQDEYGQTKSKTVSGHDPGNGDLYLTFFFGPMDGNYPGDTYDFTDVTMASNGFKVVCDVAPATYLTTSVELLNVYVYNTGIFYKVLPTDYPMITNMVTQ